ncbi:MAG: HflK protein [Gemmatimonadota bacterium]|nr:MAG: HflK protein [Gemmatimonadota bacterium]
MLLDAIYVNLNIDPGAAIGEMQGIPLWVSVPAAVIFAGLLFVSFRRAPVPGEFLGMVRGLEWLAGFRFNRRFGIGLVAAAAVIGLLSLCVVQVPPGNQALVRHFGAPRGSALDEGLHFKWPPPIDSVQMVHTDQVRRVEVGFRSGASESPAPLAPGNAQGARGLEEEAVFLTGDENLLSTRGVVQYRVLDAARFAWGFREPERVLRLETIAETLEVLAGQNIDGVYTGARAHVEQLVLEGLRHRAEQLNLGVEILHYCLRDVHAPPEVHAAFRDVASAQEDKQTAINVALRFLDESVNLARGEAARTVEEAKALSVGDVLRAEGTAVSLKARADAYQERPTGTFTRLYLETVEEVLAGSRKIIRPGWAGSGDVDLWISQGSGTPAPVTDVIRGSDVRRDEAERVGE